MESATPVSEADLKALLKLAKLDWKVARLKVKGIKKQLVRIQQQKRKHKP